MNKQTVKSDKDNKLCKGCKSSIRPIVAGNETCEMFEKREDDKPQPPYQIFLRVNDRKDLPEIVARPAGDESYPVDHVKICGLTVDSLDGWDVAKAICEAVERNDVLKDDILKDVLDAYDILNDVCTLNESLSSKSAVELVTCAKRIMGQIAGRLQIPLDEKRIPW